MKRKIFILVGAHTGKESVQFSRINPGFKHYIIEPSSELIGTIKEKTKELSSCEIIEKAASTKDGTITFYKGKPNTHYGSQSGSLRADKETQMTGETEIVSCFDFPKWIKQFKDDFVYVHMDCEGAEYDILPPILKDSPKDYIDLIAVEFHGHKLKDVSEEKHNELKNNLSEIFGNRFKQFHNDCVDVDVSSSFFNLKF
jgi:FkbM family methyltransferase